MIKKKLSGIHYLRFVSDLERHVSNVHDKHRTPCLICGKKYSDLRQHVRIVHEGAKVRNTGIPDNMLE